MNILGFGLPELIVVAVILLLFFGPKRLPGLFRSLGSSINEFKEGLSAKPTPTEETTTTPSTTSTSTPTTTVEARDGDKQ